ncbi:MAG: RNA-guided endonuclease InsQ/TnpB family protein [Candidatus Nitrosocosmicus sp.]
MILTYKIFHHKDFKQELSKALKIAEFALRTKSRTSKDVKHIGLKSIIANQILKKYGSNKSIKRVRARNIKLVIPNQGIVVDKALKRIRIPCLNNFILHYYFSGFEKVNQIEIGEKIVYISVTIPEKESIQTTLKTIGVDLNTTGHVAVVSSPKTGKAWKLGKSAQYIHKKYMNIRRNLQKKGKYKKAIQIKDRESRIVRNLNHHISKKIVEIASTNKCSNINLERLQNIRKTATGNRIKNFRYLLNSWSFYRLQKMIEYKAKLQGIVVSYIDPRYTSKSCSRCGHIGDRYNKKFKCHYCGHVDHADINAAFNIGKPVLYCVLKGHEYQSNIERDVLEWSTDTHESATLSQTTPETLEPQSQ